MKTFLHTNKGWAISMLLLFAFLLALMLAIPEYEHSGSETWSLPEISTPSPTPSPTAGWWGDLPTPVPLKSEE